MSDYRSIPVAMTSTLKMFWVALCVLLISCNLRSSCTAAATMTSITPASNETTISTAADDVSPLAKFVLLFSQPGAFARETQALFGGELISTTASPCPSGEEGLICRRLEARRGAHECAGGSECASCRDCEESRAVEWPRCCKRHFLCCSNLAAACQRCDRPELAAFCAKRFKRCF